jgi:hypothetical protein
VAGLKDVHLIATHGADLGLPKLTRFRMDGETIAIAVAVGEDFRLGSGLADASR